MRGKRPWVAQGFDLEVVKNGLELIVITLHSIHQGTTQALCTWQSSSSQPKSSCVKLT